MNSSRSGSTPQLASKLRVQKLQGKRISEDEPHFPSTTARLSSREDFIFAAGYFNETLSLVYLKLQKVGSGLNLESSVEEQVVRQLCFERFFQVIGIL